MSKYNFPIASIEGNEIVSTSGDKSYFYKLKSYDLEQKDNVELSNVFSHIETSLNNLSSLESFKFYHLNGENFLNSSTFNPQVGLELYPCNEPMEVFFEGTDIFSDIGIYDDYILYNGKYRRIVSVRSFNEEEIDEFFLPRGFDYILNIRRKDNEKALKILDRVRMSHGAGQFKPKRDFESEGAYTQAENLIQDITHGEESIFDMELFFIVSEESLEKLNSRTFDLISTLKIKGTTPFIEGHSIRSYKSGLFQIFRELIVGVKPKFKFRSIPNKTGHLKFLIPISESHFMKQGIDLSDISGKEIFFNPFSKEFKSRNMLVTGSTGGGKSVFVNKIVHALISKHPAVILDKGGSFKKICIYHNGHNLESGINPLDFRCSYYLREFVLSAVDKDKFQKLEKGLLLKEIKGFLEDYQGNSFFDLLNHLESSFKGISLYFEDIKDFITTSNCEVKRLLYVDIENYPSSQIAPLIIYILEYFKNIPESEKVLVFDECWKFLKDHGEYIDECFRTFRKSGAFPIAISQGLADFSCLGGDLYSSITNNSYFKVFFPQEYIEDKDVSEFDNERISSLQYRKGEYSECYLKTQDGLYKKILRIFLSPLELELFHTESGQSDNFFKFFKDKRDYFSSNKETIDSFVRLHHGMA